MAPRIKEEVPSLLKKILIVFFSFCIGIITPPCHAEIELPRFSEISAGVYRSGRPNKEALEMLKNKYKMKTIVNLENNADAIQAESAWADSLEINLFSVPMDASVYPKDAAVNEALAYLANLELRPVLIHCMHGRDRTGLIVGLYRVEQESWEPGRAYTEMKEKGFRPFFFNLDRYFRVRTGMTLDDNILFN